ncbi:MAG: family 2A encapsulin nanocompartment cargo protein cysteine desulfurase [Terracidiphilus sp.]|nr:family 2A encapsulin nanocompartment cargo protein cysteine desulfurase [Terracidiphilus sp.]MDR3775740.1 family 2A encapsulin nanocompartment cargo protein cysteine desulfurase [Terracidiphilus sp.]
MSTSEPLHLSTVIPDRSDWAAGLLGSDAIAPGLLSPTQLARMANEIFNALPEPLQAPTATAAAALLPPNSAFSGNPYAAVPNPTAPAVPGLLASLEEALPGALVATPDRSIVPDAHQPAATPAVPGSELGQVIVPPVHSSFAFLQDARPLFVEPAEPAAPHTSSPTNANAATSEEGHAAIPLSLSPDVQPALSLKSFQPPAPAVPGALGFADSSAAPTFSFMEEARPLFSTPPSIPGPVPAASPTGIPAFAKEDSTGSANPFASPLDLSAPQLPGTVAHAPDYRAPASYDPQKQPRPLSSVDVVPEVAPAAGQPELLDDLGLSSYAFDVEAIRRDFPILREVVNGHPLIWLDNGATTQKPQSVIDRLSYFYEHENSNVHRAAHELAARSTDAYESAREKTRRFLNAGATREIVFVRGATEAINLVAQNWGRRNIQRDDEIVITWMEHHANIVPWQMLCAEKGARLRVAPVDDSGQILLDEYEKLLGPKTRLVSITHVSNALGTILPVQEMVEAAHRHGALALVDGAQAVSHMRVDVQAINCDFYVFSGHKVFAPTGIGVVYGKSEVLDAMPPWQGGGNMIEDVTFEKTLYQPPPQRFEAGTGNIADAVGLGAAIDYLDRVGIANVSRHEHMLLTYATAALLKIPSLHIIGTAKEKAGVLSFVLDGFRTEEIGDYLNRKGIAVRGGHHCAQPILRRFGLESTVRATLALYNTCEEIDALVAALWDLRQGRNPGLV